MHLFLFLIDHDVIKLWETQLHHRQIVKLFPLDASFRKTLPFPGTTPRAPPPPLFEDSATVAPTRPASAQTPSWTAALPRSRETSSLGSTSQSHPSGGDARRTSGIGIHPPLLLPQIPPRRRRYSSLWASSRTRQRTASFSTSPRPTTTASASPASGGGTRAATSASSPCTPRRCCGGGCASTGRWCMCWTATARPSHRCTTTKGAPYTSCAGSGGRRYTERQCGGRYSGTLYGSYGP